MIIVLGGTGFIGMYTIEALLKDGQEVIATGRNKAIGKKIEEMGVDVISMLQYDLDWGNYGFKKINATDY